jgi:hypothetical protein
MMIKNCIPRMALAALVLIATAGLAFADIPNPETVKADKKSEIKTRMHISTDDKVKEARLLIPRSIWGQMRAGLDGQDAQTASAATRLFNMTGARTIISGIFLSLAFAFGGVWLMRARLKDAPKISRATALALAVLFLCGMTATIAYSNAGPPPEGRSFTSKMLTRELQWWGVYGEVKVEIVDEGDEIRMVIPRVKDKQE